MFLNYGDSKPLFTAKFIQNKTNGLYKPWSSLGKLADAISWNKMKFEVPKFIFRPRKIINFHKKKHKLASEFKQFIHG